VLINTLSKWLTVGRIKPGTHGLWTGFVYKWDYGFAQRVVWLAGVAPFIFGTQWDCVINRMMGVKIGKRVYLGEHLFDHDMLELQDDVILTGTLQAHTFEDRVLKHDRIVLSKGASVGRHSVVLYGSEVGKKTIVTPGCVVMKSELLLPSNVYSGVPTRPMWNFGAVPKSIDGWSSRVEINGKLYRRRAKKKGKRQSQAQARPVFTLDVTKND